METIFVSIPSFRDVETQHTISNLFDVASHPERVYVGVFYQIDVSEEEVMFRIPYAYPANVREKRISYVDARGPCYARHVVQSLYQGEHYVLSLDSHMRLVQGWDDLLISQLALCTTSMSPMPILTTYPCEYTIPPDGCKSWKDAIVSKETRPPFLVSSDSLGHPDGMLRFKGRLLRNQHKNPLPSFFWVSGFAFSRGSVIKDAPYDPDLPYLFFGEETLMTIRLWTHGYDFFCPGVQIAYHLWERSYRPTFWQTMGDKEKALQAESLEKARRIVENAEQGPFGVGSVRSVKQYWELCGIDFEKRIVTEKAKLGGMKKEDFFDPKEMVDAVFALMMHQQQNNLKE